MKPPPIRIARAASPNQVDEVRSLFLEYERFLRVELCFQSFEAELAGLPGKYAPPAGALLLATDGPRPAGCAALRKFGDGIGEMKRLFVRPEYRGRGVGRALAMRVLDEATAAGYACIRLDTLARLKEAGRLYQSLGFKQIKPYYPNPLEDVVYWELALTGACPKSPAS
ncbi:MAG TPA: GNAT family N-acetyltransferase [Dongiaceae bacterium]|nr:GNAT family N-acetyltransferase [Dongiaceae bacterium]